MAGHSEPIQLIAENISTIGLKFVSHTKLSLGDELKISLLLKPPFPVLSAVGQVLWCDSKIVSGKTLFEGGIEFLSISDIDRKLLEKYIDRYYYILH